MCLGHAKGPLTTRPYGLRVSSSVLAKPKRPKPTTQTLVKVLSSATIQFSLGDKNCSNGVGRRGKALSPDGREARCLPCVTQISHKDAATTHKDVETNVKHAKNEKQDNASSPRQHPTIIYEIHKARAGNPPGEQRAPGPDGQPEALV